MAFTTGRAEKAAQLHAAKEVCEMDSKVIWDAVKEKANDQRGGDRWKRRGSGGAWHRLHTTPRRSLFTPYKVAKGPGQGVKMNQTRFTRGITQSGRSFEFHDDWTIPINAHRVLEEPWIGSTVFIEEDKSTLLDSQVKIQVEKSNKSPHAIEKRDIGRMVWADVIE